jgi:SAM-dependent methyltransferase
MDRFYANNPGLTSMCLEAARTFKTLVSENDKPLLRILEIGAGEVVFKIAILTLTFLLPGVGGLTTFIVDAMGDLRNRAMEYTVSDLSPLLASRLAQSFKHTSQMVAKTYDISKPPLEQGLVLEQFDIILGLNVIHAAPDLKDTLSHLFSLLAPGGHLLAVDFDGTLGNEASGKIWTDYIFGTFPGWFGFTDERAHCTCSPEEWKQVLEAVGYMDVRFCQEDAAMSLLIDAVRK